MTGRSGRLPNQRRSRSHLDLDEPARLNPELRAGRHDGRGVVFRNDRGAVFMKPYREGVSIENGHVRPSLIEEHPTTAHFRNRTLTGPRKCDGPRQPDREPNRNDLNWLLPCRVSEPLPVLPPECPGENAAQLEVVIVAQPH